MDILITKAAADKLADYQKTGKYHRLDIIKNTCCTFAFIFDKGRRREDDRIIEASVIANDIDTKDFAAALPGQITSWASYCPDPEHTGQTISVPVTSRAFAMLKNVIIDCDDRSILHREFKVFQNRDCRSRQSGE